MIKTMIIIIIMHVIKIVERWKIGREGRLSATSVKHLKSASAIQCYSVLCMWNAHRKHKTQCTLMRTVRTLNHNLMLMNVDGYST